MISSNKLNVSGGGCNKAMTNVDSRLSATLLVALIISKVVAESRPLEIASMNFMGFGLIIISPVVTLLFCPPLTPLIMASPTIVFLHPSNPSILITLFIFLKTSSPWSNNLAVSSFLAVP